MAEEPTTPTAVKPEGGKEPEAKAEPDKTFTQSELDGIVRDRLDRERKKYEGFDDLKAKAERFDELSEKDKTESEKLSGKLSKETQRADAAEAKLLRFEVATEKNVPAKLVPLLTGSSKEELETQADLILENAQAPTPNFDGGAREAAPEPKSPEQSHNETLLRLAGLTPNT